MNKEKMEAFAEVLKEKEEMNSEEIYEVLYNEEATAE